MGGEPENLPLLGNRLGIERSRAIEDLVVVNGEDPCQIVSCGASNEHPESIAALRPKMGLLERAPSKKAPPLGKMSLSCAVPALRSEVSLLTDLRHHRRRGGDDRYWWVR